LWDYKSIYRKRNNSRESFFFFFSIMAHGPVRKWDQIVRKSENMRWRLGTTNGRSFEKFRPITEGRHMTQRKNGVHDVAGRQGRVNGVRLEKGKARNSTKSY